MKKVLLGTSAIALAGAFASQANAAEWEVRVGGYMEQHVAYSDVDARSDGSGVVFTPNQDFDGVDVKQDAEIHFLPSITLDNGLQIGANVQLEGNTSGDQIDESYLFIDGSFGRILLGSENSAGYLMTYTAPDVTPIGVNSGSLTIFVPFPAGTSADVVRMTLGSSTVETLGNNDSQRITYFTPRFAGFQVGVSYARDGTQDNNAQIDCNAAPCDFFDVGANYVNSFGDFSIALSGRYGVADVPGSGGDPEVWAAGLNLGYAGFTIGGSYAESDKDHGVQEGQYWDAGISYETGPWGFSFTYADGENVNSESLTGGDEELQQYLLGVSYALAQGVTLSGWGGYVDFEEDANDINGPDDVDAWIIGTSIAVSF